MRSRISKFVKGDGSLFEFIFHRKRPYRLFSWRSTPSEMRVRGIAGITSGFAASFPIDAPVSVQLEFLGGLLVHKPLRQWWSQSKFGRNKSLKVSSAHVLVKSDAPVRQLTSKRWKVQVSWWFAKRQYLTQMAPSVGRGRISLDDFFSFSERDDGSSVLIGKKTLHGLVLVVQPGDLEKELFRVQLKMSQLFLFSEQENIFVRRESSLAWMNEMYAKAANKIREIYPTEEILVYGDRTSPRTYVVSVISDNDDELFVTTLYDLLRHDLVPPGLKRV